MKKFSVSIVLALLAMMIYDIAFLANRFIKPIPHYGYVVIGIILVLLLIISIALFIMKLIIH